MDRSDISARPPRQARWLGAMRGRTAFALVAGAALASGAVWVPVGVASSAEAVVAVGRAPVTSTWSGHAGGGSRAGISGRRDLTPLRDVAEVTDGSRAGSGRGDGKGSGRKAGTGSGRRDGKGGGRKAGATGRRDATSSGDGRVILAARVGGRRDTKTSGRRDAATGIGSGRLGAI
jgi:hypothetical protein